MQFDSLLLIPNPQGRPSCMPAEHMPSGLTRRVVWRIAFALLLVTGWAWQARRRLGVVDLYPTTPTARPGAAPRVPAYPAGAPAVCVYLVYTAARPGVDHYAYRFVQGDTTLLRDAAHVVPVSHGAALDCYDTGGALPAGRYAVDLLVDGAPTRRVPFIVLARGQRR